jgi:hypothetical protein
MPYSCVGSHVGQPVRRALDCTISAKSSHKQSAPVDLLTASRPRSDAEKTWVAVGAWPGVRAPRVPLLNSRGGHIWAMRCDNGGGWPLIRLHLGDAVR